MRPRDGRRDAADGPRRAAHPRSPEPPREPRAHRRGGDRAGARALLRGAERGRGHARGGHRPHDLLPPLRRPGGPADAARAARRSSSSSRPRSASCQARPERTRRGGAAARSRPPSTVYQRHGPLLRCIAEAAAGDEQIAAGYDEMRKRFDDFAEQALRELADLGRMPPAEPRRDRSGPEPDERELPADAFGREPRVPPETRGADPHRDLGRGHPPLTKGAGRMDVFRTPDERFENLPGYRTSPTTSRWTACACTTSTRAAARPCSASTASRAGATSTGTCSTGWSGSGHRVVCPDLVGFGRSDKPTDQGWYTYDRHVEVGHPPPRADRARGRDRGGAGLGRPDRAALGGRARRPGRRGSWS